MTTFLQSANTPFSELENVFKAQQARVPALAASTANERIRKLKRLAGVLMAHRTAIQEALFADFHKPAMETDVIEIFPLLVEIKHTSRRLHQWMRPKAVDTPFPLLGTSSQIRYEPKGAVLIIAPWNFPLQLALEPLISAVAAGNAVIVKPSEFTPHTSAIMKKMLLEVFPENEVAVVEGDAGVAQQLLTMKFDHIFFTGSPEVGKLVMKAAAEHLTSVTLELGGKSPVIIDESADIETAARRVVAGKLSNCGQICVAPDYALVHESKQADFLTACAKYINAMYGATDEARITGDYTRIINSRHTARLKGLLEDALEKGAVSEYPGGQIQEAENYFPPVLLTNVTPAMRVANEEIFGPILPVHTFSKLDEAIQYINKKEKPLALYIFSGSRRNVERILNETSAGGVTINDVAMHFYNYNLPFGGVNNSGIGKGHGEFAFHEFSNAKAVLRQWAPFSGAEMMYPPFNSRKRKLVSWLMKYL
ncbi:MAG: aldehyde dehydrogenase family protein [Saprospiraceae bacterium]|nr:aldehyde dehydrogenase family protein [Saprospiraceae bacterium]MDZ4706268.1 aldehyde dehydrogenase family protein [Saprospiraceae bacterium]